MEFKSKLQDYTESEFLTFLEEFFENKKSLKGDDFGNYISVLVKHFEKITEHPRQSDMIFYPKEGVEDSPEGILKEVKLWRAAHNKPGFKS